MSEKKYFKDRKVGIIKCISMGTVQYVYSIVTLIVTFRSSGVLVLVCLIFLTIRHRFSIRFRSEYIAGISTPVIS